jgi:hypothetical protein
MDFMLAGWNADHIDMEFILETPRTGDPTNTTIKDQGIARQS